MTSEDANISKKGTAVKRKQVTLTIPQKPDGIWRLDSSENQRELMTSYRI